MLTPENVQKISDAIEAQVADLKAYFPETMASLEGRLAESRTRIVDTTVQAIEARPDLVAMTDSECDVRDLLKLIAPVVMQAIESVTGLALKLGA